MNKEQTDLCQTSQPQQITRTPNWKGFVSKNKEPKNRDPMTKNKEPKNKDLKAKNKEQTNLYQNYSPNNPIKTVELICSPEQRNNR